MYSIHIIVNMQTKWTHDCRYKSFALEIFSGVSGCVHFFVVVGDHEGSLGRKRAIACIGIPEAVSHCCKGQTGVLTLTTCNPLFQHGGGGGAGNIGVFSFESLITPSFIHTHTTSHHIQLRVRQQDHYHRCR